MSEVRNVIINLAPLGAGDFAFTTLKPVKTEYQEGESVYVEYAVKNNGTIASKANIRVKDIETGVVLTNYSVPEIQPGYSYHTTGSHAYVGKMPNKDWKLQFYVAP